MLAKFMPWLVPSLIAAAVALGSWFYIDYNATKAALATQTQLAQEWREISEAQERLRVREENIQQAGTPAIHIIRESPNASVLVPQDIASAWADGIDSVRDAGTKSASEHEDMSRSSSNAPERGPVDRSTSDRVLNSTRESFLAV